MFPLPVLKVINSFCDGNHEHPNKFECVCYVSDSITSIKNAVCSSNWIRDKWVPVLWRAPSNNPIHLLRPHQRSRQTTLVSVSHELQLDAAELSGAALARRQEIRRQSARYSIRHPVLKKGWWVLRSWVRIRYRGRSWVFRTPAPCPARRRFTFYNSFKIGWQFVTHPSEKRLSTVRVDIVFRRIKRRFVIHSKQLG